MSKDEYDANKFALEQGTKRKYKHLNRAKRAINKTEKLCQKLNENLK